MSNYPSSNIPVTILLSSNDQIIPNFPLSKFVELTFHIESNRNALLDLDPEKTLMKVKTTTGSENTDKNRSSHIFVRYI